MTGRIAVVTGGAGFIGRHLVTSLLAQGMRVRVIDPAPRPQAFPPAVDYRMASILEPQVLRTAFAGADEVYHLAAIAHLWVPRPAEYETVNVEGTGLVLEEAAAAKVPTIVATSTETMLRGWRDRSGTPVRETNPLPAPAELAGAYTRSKARAHALALDAAGRGAPVRIVYPTVPIGPGDEALTAPTVMVRDFLSGRTPAYLNSLMNYVPVEDAARGHILAARRGAPGGRYSLAGEDIWLRQMLALLQRLSGRPMPRIGIPFWLAYATGALSTWLADHMTRKAPQAPLEGVKLVYAPRPIDGSHARRALGFAPGPVEAALARLIAWLEATGHVPSSPRRDSQPGSERVNSDAMTENRRNAPPERPEREQRLAEALRRNLARRKAQARARAAEPKPADAVAADVAAAPAEPKE